MERDRTYVLAASRNQVRDIEVLLVWEDQHAMYDIVLFERKAKASGDGVEVYYHPTVEQWKEI